MAHIFMKTTVGRLVTLASGVAMAAALWAGFGGALSAAPPADPETCFPTCEVDGRSLVVAGNDDTTLAAVEITLGLRFTQANSPEFNFELFDGDSDITNWDVLYNGGPGVSAPVPDLEIELWADPNGGGPIDPAAVLLKTWTVGEIAFANNAWTGATFPHNAAAISGANYQYALRLRPVNPAVNKGWNAFKVKALGTVLLLGNQVVGFIGAMNVPNDLNNIYPGYPSLANSVYDGKWSFKFALPPFLGDVTVFDGDMDFGNSVCDYKDTDDTDSTGIPAFATGGNAAAEGVANGGGSGCTAPGSSGFRTGVPADDNGGAAFRRVPSLVPAGIAYKMIAPDGQIFLNQNPSGNREWEQFKIQLVQDAEDVYAGACPVTGGYPGEPEKAGYPANVGKGYPASDCRTEVLPGGTWEIELDGMDLSNLNFWFFSFKVEPINNEFQIGRLVWYDTNENGAQDIGDPTEIGIPNVAITVKTGGVGGTTVATAVTDANGEFLLGMPAGDYTVIVDAANLDPGGPLEGWTSTTGGEVINNVEVGLPVCTDTNVPAGCGQPLYNEAIFGYVEHFEECVITPIKGGPPFIGAVHTYVPNPPGTPAGYLTMRTTLAKVFVDNTYGTNAIGWPSGHTFAQLVGSDHMQISLYDDNDVKKLEFKMDYITASAGAPGGYKTLGVSGGEGAMILGAASNIYKVDTSISKNFTDGMWLTVNSPATDASYTPNATYPNWIYEVYYDVTFDTTIFGGAAHFGYPRLVGIHASPSKTGSNTEICVYGDQSQAPPVANADTYEVKKNTQKTFNAPGVLGNDTAGAGGAMTATLFQAPTKGTLVGGLNANGSFTYKPNTNVTGEDTFKYQANNANGASNVATVKVTIKK